MRAKGFVKGIGVTVVLSLAIPASAAAATNFYVDKASGDNTNACTSPGAACKTIQAAVTKAAAGDTVHIVDPAAPTIYTENVNDNHGVSIVSDSPDVSDNVIDGANGGPGISLSGSSLASPARISGLTLRGNQWAVDVGSPAFIDQNHFDEAGPITGGFSPDLALEATASGSTVIGNFFEDTDPDPAETQTAIATSVTGSVTIAGNQMDGFSTGVIAQGGDGSTPAISGNTITGVRPNLSGLGSAITVTSGHPTIARNEVRQPAFANVNNSLLGVLINVGAGDMATGATLRANRFAGLTGGLYAGNTGGGVSLSGDLVANSAQYGVRFVDDNADDPDAGDGTLTNVDIVGTAALGNDVVLGQTDVTINSSILTSVPAVDDSGGGSCSIAFSRGPTTGGTACQTFQTSADPQFVNAAAGNYHLAASSPMLDAGDPATPAVDAVDLDGGAFGIASACPGGPGRRDIGADEFVPSGCPPAQQPTDPIDQTPPDETPPDQTPPQGDPPDATAPETTLTKVPKAKLKRRTARFAFTANEGGATFVCALDGAKPAPCSSPLKLKRLKAGKHRFAVAAVDAAGNTDTTPAVAKFKVKPRRR